MSSEYTLETSFQYNSTAYNACNVLGTRNGASGDKQFGLFVTPSNGKCGYWWGGTDTTQTFTPFTAKNTLFNVKFNPVGKSQTYPNNATITINGTEYNTGATATEQTWQPWIGFFQYGISATSTSTSSTDVFCGQQIGETIIKNGDSVIHHLKPAYDGTYYGLYDSVTDTFYYNESKASDYICGNWS